MKIWSEWYIDHLHLVRVTFPIMSLYQALQSEFQILVIRSRISLKIWSEWYITLPIWTDLIFCHKAILSSCYIWHSTGTEQPVWVSWNIIILADLTIMQHWPIQYICTIIAHSIQSQYQPTWLVMCISIPGQPDWCGDAHHCALCAYFHIFVCEGTRFRIFAIFFMCLWSLTCLFWFRYCSMIYAYDPVAYAPHLRHFPCLYYALCFLMPFSPWFSPFW